MNPPHKTQLQNRGPTCGAPGKRSFLGKGGAAERVSVQDAARENSEACRRRDSNVRKGEKYEDDLRKKDGHDSDFR